MTTPICPVHGKPMALTCGTPSCGLCYQDWLLTAPDRNADRKPFAPLPAGGFAPKFNGHGRK